MVTGKQSPRYQTVVWIPSRETMGEIEGEQKQIAGSKLLCDLGVEPQYVWNRLTGQSFSGIKKEEEKKKAQVQTKLRLL